MPIFYETHLQKPAQFLALQKDRILVRFPGRQFILRGTQLLDLRQLIELMDGKRDRESLVDTLSDRYPADAVRKTLDQLGKRSWPEGGQVSIPMATIHPPDGSLPAAKILCFSSQTRAEAIASHLPKHLQLIHQDWPFANQAPNSEIYLAVPNQEHPADFEPTTQPDTTGFDLIVFLPEGHSYQTILDAQELAQAAHCPFLFGLETNLGWELGPCVVPSSPCFSCSQKAMLKAALGDLPAFPALAPLGTLPWPNDPESSRPQCLAQEITAILDPNRHPQSLGQVTRYDWATGQPTRFRIQTDGGCSHCSNESATGTTDRTQSLHRHFQFSSRPDRPYFSSSKARQDPNLVQRIGILGGGTAGYLTALALRVKHPTLKVTLIESPDVPVIGVGEATTPLMLQFLHVDLGLDIQEFFSQVQPTIKLGIRFDWGAKTSPYFHYPFGSLRIQEAATHDHHLRHVSRQAMLMTAGKLPLAPFGPDSWDTQWDCNLAYHLDNRRFVAYLQQKALQLGIHRIQAHIKSVTTSENGQSVERLGTSDNRLLKFDLYVDCSGFRALLIEGALASPFLSFEKSLFTNRALIAKVRQPKSIPPYTQATTMNAGWCWHTPQRDANHCGYVFSTDFISESDAEAEMRQCLPTLGEAKLVQFRSGRHRDFWKGNVVAMGNAYGFVEPLESTALHMLIRQIGMLVRAFPLRHGEHGLAAMLNQRVGNYWDYLRWFLALHYRFNERLDTEFWRTCRQTVCLESHRHLLQTFRERGPLSLQPGIWETMNIPDPLWGAEGIDLLLLAQGVACPLPLPNTSRQDWQGWVQRTQGAIEQALPQHLALATMDQQPPLLQKLAAVFQSHGAAFPMPVT